MANLICPQLAGLVHDIGLLPLYLHADRHHLGFCQTTMEENLLRKFAAVIGTRLLQSWDFPEELVDVAAGHEDMHRVNNSGVADYVDVVMIANLQMLGTAKFVSWANVFASERLGYYAGESRNFLTNHAEQLATAREMLGINVIRH